MSKMVEKTFTNDDGAQVKLHTTRIPGRETIRVFNKLWKIPVDIFKSGTSSSNEVSIGEMDIGAIVNCLLENLEDDKVMTLIYEIFQSSKIGADDLNSDIGFDKVFAGDLGLLFEVLLFVCELNFSSLWKKKATFMKMIPQKVKIYLAKIFSEETESKKNKKS